MDPITIIALGLILYLVWTNYGLLRRLAGEGDWKSGIVSYLLEQLNREVTHQDVSAWQDRAAQGHEAAAEAAEPKADPREVVTLEEAEQRAGVGGEANGAGGEEAPAEGEGKDGA